MPKARIISRIFWNFFEVCTQSIDMSMKERGRKRESPTETERDRQKAGQTDKQTTDRHTDI